MLPSRTPSALARPLFLVVVVLLLAALTAFVTLRLDDSQAAPSQAAGDDVTAPEEAPAAVVPAALAPTLPARCASVEELIPTTAMRCDLNPQRPGAPTLVLWGDSHAWQMVPAIRAAAAGSGVNLVGFLFGSCPVMDPAFPSQRAMARAAECPQVNAMALSFLRKLQAEGRPVRLVLAEGWELYRDAIEPPSAEDAEFATPSSETIDRTAVLGETGTPRLFSTLARIGVPTDVVAPMPMVPTNAPVCDDPSGGLTCDLPREGALKDDDAIRADLASMMGGLESSSTLVDPTGALCDDSTCAGVVDDLPVYLDNIHLGAQVSARLGSYFDETIDKLLASAR